MRKGLRQSPPGVWVPRGDQLQVKKDNNASKLGHTASLCLDQYSKGGDDGQ